MNVVGIDERKLGSQGHSSNYVVFIFDGDEHDRLTSWSVNSLLLTEAALPDVLAWLRQHLPTGCCWSLGVVYHPARPTPHDQVEVVWIIGDDVLNTPREARDRDEQRVAEEMLARRHEVPLL